KGYSRAEAIIEAGRTRLRPILMTSLCLIAGMVPVAIGLNEVSNQRRSLGMSVIGGVVSSTFVTLIVIPAVFSYMENIRGFLLRFATKLVTAEEAPAASNGNYNHRDSFAGNPDDTPPRSKTV